jgi:uncharacterized small protein (TIGR04563 family)
MGTGRGNSHGSRIHRKPAVEASQGQPTDQSRKADPRKVSVYLPDTLLHEIRAEANRLERSLSWILQKAWRVAREEVRKLSI